MKTGAIFDKYRFNRYSIFCLNNSLTDDIAGRLVRDCFIKFLQINEFTIPITSRPGLLIYFMKGSVVNQESIT